MLPSTKAYLQSVNTYFQLINSLLQIDTKIIQLCIKKQLIERLTAYILQPDSDLSAENFVNLQESLTHSNLEFDKGVKLISKTDIEDFKDPSLIDLRNLFEVMWSLINVAVDPYREIRQRVSVEELQSLKFKTFHLDFNKIQQLLLYASSGELRLRAIICKIIAAYCYDSSKDSNVAIMFIEKTFTEDKTAREINNGFELLRALGAVKDILQKERVTYFFFLSFWNACFRTNRYLIRSYLDFNIDLKIPSRSAHGVSYSSK